MHLLRNPLESCSRAAVNALSSVQASAERVLCEWEKRKFFDHPHENNERGSQICLPSSLECLIAQSMRRSIGKSRLAAIERHLSFTSNLKWQNLVVSPWCNIKRLISLQAFGDRYNLRRGRGEPKYMQRETQRRQNAISAHGELISGHKRSASGNKLYFPDLKSDTLVNVAFCTALRRLRIRIRKSRLRDQPKTRRICPLSLFFSRELMRFARSR
jgi:hypothetical protein